MAEQTAAVFNAPYRVKGRSMGFADVSAGISPKLWCEISLPVVIAAVDWDLRVADFGGRKRLSYASFNRNHYDMGYTNLLRLRFITQRGLGLP